MYNSQTGISPLLMKMAHICIQHEFRAGTLKYTIHTPLRLNSLCLGLGGFRHGLSPLPTKDRLFLEFLQQLWQSLTS